MNNEEKIAEAIERAQVAHSAAHLAIESRDKLQAPALVREALILTLEAMALAARGGWTDPIGQLAPNVGFYVRILQVFEASPFDTIADLRLVKP